MSAIASVLAPRGVLRAGINMSNFLLVSSRGQAGEPIGVSPDMAAALAKQLNVELELVQYKNPGLLADAAPRDEWDVALIGAEPARAEHIHFTQPYAEIEATYLVKEGDLRDIEDVDQRGVRICVSARSAYDLWLSANLKHATLTRTEEPGLELSRKLFDTGDFAALAGLRPWLLEQATSIEGARVLPGRFTAVQQAIGAPKARCDRDVARFLDAFVSEATASGLVASLIAKHGQEGRLSVAKEPSTTTCPRAAIGA
jgi:polar amino acid transport system substrate-binding protein